MRRVWLALVLLLAVPLCVRGQGPVTSSPPLVLAPQTWQYIAGAAAASWNPANSTSYYLSLNVGSLVGNPGTSAPTVNTSVYGKTQVATTIRWIYLEFYCGVAAVGGQTATLDIRVNNTTNTQLLTGINCPSGSFAANAFNATNLSVALAANDWFTLKFNTPAWGTPPTGAFISTTIHAD